MISKFVISMFRKEKQNLIRRTRRTNEENETAKKIRFNLISRKQVCNFEEREKYYKRVFNV